MSQKITWRTYQGKTVDLYSIDHQHFSNTYWYQLLINGVDLLAKSEVYREALEDRFEGELLKYRPPLDFRYEINQLKEKGYLKREGDKVFIAYQGKIVGEAV